MKRSTRKGFTLIELLIVTVIIGVLAGMFTLSTLKPVASTEAAKIAAGFKSISTALNMWYLDNMKTADEATNLETLIMEGNTNIKSVKEYLQDGRDLLYTGTGTEAANYTTGKYRLNISNNSWWLTYTLAQATGDVNDALKARSDEYGFKDPTNNYAGDYSGGQYIAYKAR